MHSSASSASSNTIRIGIIGAGARMRAVVSNVLKNVPDGRIKVTAVYDPLPASLEKAGKELGHEFDRVSSEEALATYPDVDWVFIGSWNCFHARQAVQALKAGKNVFCEKPLATTFEDCLTIRDAAAGSPGIFAFGLVLRY